MKDVIDELIFSYNKVKQESKIKYLDWEKARQICLEHPDSCIYAGIRGDMGNTGGLIFDHGKWCDEYVYDHSWCGTPILEIFEEELEIPCWTYEPHEHSGVPTWWMV